MYDYKHLHIPWNSLNFFKLSYLGTIHILCNHLISMAINLMQNKLSSLGIIDDPSLDEDED